MIQLFALIFNILLFFPLCAESNIHSHYVLVSVAPHKYFVEQIADGTVEVGLMVPAGSSAHTFEPSPKKMLQASKADIWFIIGEGFEKKASAAIKSYNPGMQLIDLRQNIDLINEHTCQHAHAEGACQDLHFWLSPRLAKIQARTIAEALIKTYPENEDKYRSRLELFLKELDNLDQEIVKILQKPHNHIILVSHPAYAYYCRDYNFTQLSIEFEGKDPTPQQLTKILDQARKGEIKMVFVQMQYSSKGARLIADYLGAKVVTLDPYSEKYIETLLDITKNFASQPPT